MTLQSLLKRINRIEARLELLEKRVQLLTMTEYTGENEKDYPNQEQDIMDELNEGYNEYKKINPDFAKVVEGDSAGKIQ